MNITWPVKNKECNFVYFESETNRILIPNPMSIAKPTHPNLSPSASVTEDKVAYARQFYNDSILSYNNLCTTFPGQMFASMFGRKQKEYLQIAESEKKVVKVEF